MKKRHATETAFGICGWTNLTTKALSFCHSSSSAGKISDSASLFKRWTTARFGST